MQFARSNKNSTERIKKEHGQTLENSILKTLAYFDIFRYPLLEAEIRQFLDIPVITIALEHTIKNLVEKQRIFRLGEFYSLRNDQSLAEYRKKGNDRAKHLLKKGMRIADFLYHFPFVKAVGISGSLSKNFADPKADIDFFIITSKNRLWVARSILHLYKKLTYLAGRQNYYCMNYFVDETALNIEQRNIYTATEIKTLLPVKGKIAFENFFRINEWSDEFLPVYPAQQLPQEKKAAIKFKQLIERICNAGFGERLDNWLMKITASRWKSKELKGKKNKKGLTLGLITGKHFARTNPDFFQEKLLALYHDKVSLLLQGDNVIISDTPPGPF
jgi:hypothetical protein